MSVYISRDTEGRDGYQLTVHNEVNRCLMLYLTEEQGAQIAERLTRLAKPNSPRAVTPAKAMARMRPPILRYARA